MSPVRAAKYRTQNRTSKTFQLSIVFLVTHTLLNYVSDKIYGLSYDPEQKMNLLVGKNNDKHYAGERVRLKMIYERDFLGIKPKMGQLNKIETLEK